MKTTRRKLTENEKKKFFRPTLVPDSFLQKYSVLFILFFLFFWAPFFHALGISGWVESAYYWVFLLSILILLGVWIHFKELWRSKRTKIEIEKRVREKFVFIELVLKKAVTFEDEEDLGPYLVADAGSRRLILFAGQFLLEFKKIDRSTVRIVLDSEGELIQMECLGAKIKVHSVASKEKQKAFENLICNKTHHSIFVFKGDLDTWDKDLVSAEITKIS
jgi:hypothetical protein